MCSTKISRKQKTQQKFLDRRTSYKGLVTPVEFGLKEEKQHQKITGCLIHKLITF
ncbi:expressed protein [Arabidopsis lyrata subsp. lyrata]|uniref:Expressed protein n=1 Tax=Arabidopsis lyrata subsp. lyrata TaxID=81972 RepID=D7M733_ARALL|nr:expressed protein [Arabidopsis lyrata subsp. lyrata]